MTKDVNEVFQPLSATILVVDDDTRLLAALKTRLEAIGCRCIACVTAGEAMVHIATTHIDLVITDLALPGVDGLSILGLIRNESDTPVIVISGHPEKYGRLLDRFRNVSVMQKPFEIKELVRCVRFRLLQTAHPKPSLPPRVA